MTSSPTHGRSPSPAASRAWTVIGIYTDAYDEHGPVLAPLGYVEGQVQVRGDDTRGYQTWATSVVTDDESQVYDLAVAQLLDPVLSADPNREPSIMGGTTSSF